MKKLGLSIILMLLTLEAGADSYDSLWKQVKSATDKDLPRTQLSLLQKIADKARSEHNYGQLLSAEIQQSSVWASISPDSLAPAVRRLEAQETAAQKTNPVLAAVYESALGRIYLNNGTLSEDYKTISKNYYDRSLAHPDQLAAVKTNTYKPLFDEGTDSRIFGNDLLHVLGLEAGNSALLHQFYQQQGNRPAACIMALKELQENRENYDNARSLQSAYTKSLDSLLTVYHDIPEAGEVAIERYSSTKRDTAFHAADQVAWLNNAINTWSAWPRINELRNELTELENPQFTLNLQKSTILPHHRHVILLKDVRHIGTLAVTISRLKADGLYDPTLDNNRGYQEARSRIINGTSKTFTHDFSNHQPYDEVNDSIVIDGLEPGVYLVEAKAENTGINTQRALLHVSDVTFLAEKLPENQTRFVTVSATTGQPIPGASLRIFPSSGKGETVTLTTDTKGETIYTSKSNIARKVFAYTAKDNYAPAVWSYGTNFSYAKPQEHQELTNLFTDRSIYRPGQTVHVATISFSRDGGDQTTALANKKMTFTLRDANYQEVGHKDVVTDAFGTAAADFVLPKTGLTGNFSISTSDNSSTYIQVEEYKRPTFEVSFDKVHDAYKAGDTITVRGIAKSYAGVPTQGAKVSYTIYRKPAYWCWFMQDENNTRLAEGTTTTADDGSFTLRVPMTMAPGTSRWPRIYNIEVNATVTDQGGESHDGDLSLPLGTKDRVLTCSLNEKIEKSKLKTVRFELRNLAGEEVPALIRYTIDNGRMLTDSVNKNLDLTAWQKVLKSGKHTLIGICDKDTVKTDFVLFSVNDKTPVVTTKNWYYQSSQEFPRDGKPVYVQIGSSDPDQHIVYNIISGNKVLEQGAIDQSNALTTRAFTYKPEYGDGLRLTYAWVKEGVGYQYSTVIKKPLPDKTLNVKWTSFRDRLEPGLKETWTLKITDPKGKAAKAQLMAVLYNKSLDQLYPHSWQLDLGLSRNLPYTIWSTPINNNNSWGQRGIHSYNSLNVPTLAFTQFKDEYFYSYRYFRRGFGQVLMARANVAKNESKVFDVVEQMPSFPANAKEESALDESSKQANVEGSNAQPALRENFAETAFFYPALVADEKGDIQLRFTLPETLTTWKFMGLAHDKDMDNGLLSADVVAQKKVMVQPNLPRFLRQGDNGVISAKLINTTAQTQQGQAHLELVDPATGEVLATKTQSYTLAANKTTALSFPISADTLAPGIVIARVIAEGANYSDGEQHYLPILTNREFVTQTAAFSQNGPGTKTISLDKLFPGDVTGKKATVTYTNNPAWLLIQSLPTIAVAPTDNAIDLATSYYSNRIAHSILTSTPVIRRVINLWQQEQAQDKDHSSLASALEKDADLKSLVLSETPWVLDADKEREQKAMLIDYFDENNVNSRLKTALDKLAQLQHSDGSWSWWQGMDGSYYMTTAVTETLVRLNHMLGTQTETAAMLKNAFGFLTKQLHGEVMLLKKAEKKGIKNLLPSEEALHTLYTLALDGRQLSATTNADKQYLVALMAKQPTAMTIYGKTCGAIILARNGYPRQAATWLKSANEYSVYDAEKGRYYDTPKAAYSWMSYRIPSQVAAIEAMKLLQPKEQQTITEMQQWLLQEKRTTRWNSPIDCVNAVYAFLDGNMQTLDRKPQTTITVDGKALGQAATAQNDGATLSASAGLGYIKTTVAADSHNLTFTKTTDGTSWGAVYAQYWQKSSAITAAASGISISRELRDENGKAINGPLAVGKKVIVHITITCDRDYDFVQIIDKRAACLEPVNALSGYRDGCYQTPKDYTTNYYFDHMQKGKHVIDTPYYIDRTGDYTSGTCTAECAYAPEYKGHTNALKLQIK